LVSVDDDAVIIESVKLADDRSGDVVVRLYEALGRRTSATVRASMRVAAVGTVDLLERALADVPYDGEARITLRPFQILTLRFTRT
jgi:alpha-mannosidase